MKIIPFGHFFAEAIVGFFNINAVDGNKFNPSAVGGTLVQSVAVQTDDKILTAGNFTNYGGTTDRNNLMRFYADGIVDEIFVPNAVDPVIGEIQYGAAIQNISIQPTDGKVLVSGNFLHNNIIGRRGLIRLNTDGTVDSTFVSNATDGTKFSVGTLHSLCQPDGKVLACGNFTSYNGTANRSYLVRLNSDGTTDAAFCANASDGNKFGASAPNTVLRKIAMFSDNKIVVCGDFVTNYAGVSGRRGLVKLNTDGTLDATYTDNATLRTTIGKFIGTVLNMAVQSDDKLLVSGGYTDYNGTVNRNRLVRLNTDGTLDVAFTTNSSDGNKFNSTVYSVVVQPDGKILAAGNFTNYGGTVGRNSLVRLNSDGTLDTAFCINASDGAKFSNSVRNIAVQADGKIILVGNFLNYGGITDRNYVVRINSDGTMET